MSNTDSCKETIVHQFLKVRAHVTITPIIKSGEPNVRCIEANIGPGSQGPDRRRVYYPRKSEPDCPSGKCAFTLEQILCVEVPIAIDMDVDMDPGVVECGRPGLGPCKHPHKDFVCGEPAEKLTED